jgi:hypothetical protein
MLEGTQVNHQKPLKVTGGLIFKTGPSEICIYIVLQNFIDVTSNKLSAANKHYTMSALERV